MPAKCGSSPRAKVGMVLSVRQSAPGSPMSSAHCCSLRQPASAMRPSASSAFQPWVASLSKSGWWRRARTGDGRRPALREARVKGLRIRALLVVLVGAASEQMTVAFHFPLTDGQVVGFPLHRLVLDEFIAELLAQRLLDQWIDGEGCNRLLQGLRQEVDAALAAVLVGNGVEIVLVRLARIDFFIYALQTCGPRPRPPAIRGDGTHPPSPPPMGTRRDWVGLCEP